MTEEEMDSLIKEMEREHEPYEEVKTWLLKDFLSKFYKIEFGYDSYSLMDALDGDPSAYWNID